MRKDGIDPNEATRYVDTDPTTTTKPDFITYYEKPKARRQARQSLG